MPFHLPPAYVRLLLLIATASNAAAQSLASCSPSATPTDGIRPSVASGYQAALVATGLSRPRSIQFDSAGNLLVVQSGRGIESFQLQENGGACVSVRGQRNVFQDSSLNHGLALSADGRTLYASSEDAAYSWDYDPAESSVSGNNRTLVTEMGGSDHTTRTLLLSAKVPEMLLVSLGSQDNVDLEALDEESGISQIRAFNLTNATEPYVYRQDGLRLGWGLRNSVGVAEHPETGGIYSVENSVDRIMREGKDIHQDNPGEEMNFHGYLNGTEYAAQGSYYGYPRCFAAWAVDDIPENDGLTVGSNFATGTQNDTVNDEYCAEQTAPRLTFQAHMAPIDLKFNNSGSEGWVSFRGSWNRDEPAGYKVSVIPFMNGEPVARPDNNTSTVDVLTNADISRCPDNCFRPAGLAFDRQGRLFVSSDASGEIYVITREAGAAAGGSASSSGTEGQGREQDSSAGRILASCVVGCMTLSAMFLML